MPYRRLRPHKNEQTERNRLLYAYHVEHPLASLEDIGKVFKISRARVCQILQKRPEKP
jgi:DNA-directed RNA polymerase sigma subunit (sigma70/sigma32)